MVGLGSQLLTTVIKTDLRHAMELRRASAPNIQTSRPHSVGSHPHSYAYEVTSKFFRPFFSRLVQWTSSNCFSGSDPSSHNRLTCNGFDLLVVHFNYSYIAPYALNIISYSLIPRLAGGLASWESSYSGTHTSSWFIRDDTKYIHTKTNGVI